MTNKISLISIITILCGSLFVIVPGWFNFLWGFQLLLLPFTAGMLMVLVQDENRSYRFLPRLVVGSLIISFTFTVIWWITEHDYGDRPYLFEALYIALFFTAIIIFGGLVGIVIRGTILLFKKYSKRKEK